MESHDHRRVSPKALPVHSPASLQQGKTKRLQEAREILSSQVHIVHTSAALDVLSDAGGTVPAALSALDPAVISGLFELYGQKLADQGQGHYIARLHGALGFTAVLSAL